MKRVTIIGMVCLTAFLMTFFMACSGKAGDDNAKSATDQNKGAAAEQTENKTEYPPMVYVLMVTNMGDITLELNHEKAPITVDNFMNYVDKNYYDSTIFHRVIPDFMIQGGGFTVDMTQKKTDPPIKNESMNGLQNLDGTIAMARTNDPNSATSQFFINVKDNPNLNGSAGHPGYAVFGKVISGMDVVYKISKVKTTSKGMYRDVPIDPVIIEKVRRIEAPKDSK